MHKYNGIIVVDTCEIERKLKRVGAVQNQIASYLIVGVPDWANSVMMTVFNEYEEGFPEIVGAKVEGEDGKWVVTVKDFCFPSIGDVRYELNAMVGEGDDAVMRPLGCGKIRVTRYYGKTFEPAPHPETVVANAIRDKDGGIHKIEAENVGKEGEQDWSIKVGKRIDVSQGGSVAVIESIPDPASGEKRKILAENVGTDEVQDWSISVK